MEKIETIKNETEELLKKMIDKFTLEVTEENGVFHVNIKTEEASTIIGRFGETIRSIQKILEVILYKTFGQSVEVLVNVNDFRQKQKEKLENLVENLAKKVEETGQEQIVNNLSSYERKMIHQLVTIKYPNLTSYSTGEGRLRKLVIAKKE
jgi:Predicted RNA-binding protein